LVDLVEADGGTGTIEAQVAQPPGVAGVFDLPAMALEKILDRATSVDRQCSLRHPGSVDCGEPVFPGVF
jgi:hypothetical protein